jgi:O-antigen/teichoic acid export membrane protein
MLSTAVSALFGFFFWMINTRLFTSEQIGLATALLSSVSLISGLSLVGLNTGIIRYLPKSDRKNEKINTVITIVLVITIVFATFYLLGIHYFSPKLEFIKHNIFYIMIFILITIVVSLESIYGNVFVAYKNAKYSLYKSIIGNVFKIILPFILAGFGIYAVFVSASFATIVAFIISLFVLHRLYNYKFKFTFNKNIFRKMFTLSFGNYVASFAANLPMTLLPIMIANSLGAKQAAYYYMDMMICTLLNTIQSSIGASLFAEGSNNEINLKNHVIKSIKLILVILIPSIICVFLFGKYILLFFGKEYSSEGINLLYLLSLSVIFTSINGLLGAILNVKGKVNYILLMCLIGPTILLTFIYFALPHGLIPLGIAFLVGEALISVIYLFVVLFKAL